MEASTMLRVVATRAIPTITLVRPWTGVLKSSSEWLDPSTILVSMLITNTDGSNALFPAAPEGTI